MSMNMTYRIIKIIIIRNYDFFPLCTLKCTQNNSMLKFTKAT